MWEGFVLAKYDELKRIAGTWERFVWAGGMIDTRAWATEVCVCVWMCMCVHACVRVRVCVWLAV